MNDKTTATSSPTDPHVLEVIRAAQRELAELMQQRTEIMRRIGTTKQTLIGLARLFGDAALQQELIEFMDERATTRQPGFTRACRMILMEAKQGVNSREMCEQLWRRNRELALRHKDLLASVTTVLNRLVRYGEAQATEEHGRRIWIWIANPDPASETGGLQHLNAPSLNLDSTSTGTPQ